MESAVIEGNELGAIQYISEITGASLQTVVNWFILLLIFVFDPLAITLIIATNQAFIGVKRKTNIYGEAKFTDDTLSITYPGQVIFEEESTPNTEEEKQKIQEEINKIENSGVSSKKRGQAIEELQNKLRNLDDNIKTY